MVMMSDTAAQPLVTATPVAVNCNNQKMNSINCTPKVSSDYEKCREQRIKENLERMQKLGIHDLSLKLKSIKPTTNRKNNKPYKTPNRSISPLPSSVPSRRSSRLQNTPSVSYNEVEVSKKVTDDNNVWMGEHARPEVYTDEHEKMLGDAKTKWTLFVDGYGKDGKKIYDQVRGKTCHQCRQKTLGHRTHCIKCNLVQGQFCGDCLYMRLQNTPSVSYNEVEVSKKVTDDNNVWMGEHARPEVYTDEHEKMLGDAKTKWTLFVDGYGKDGKKIYDQVRGKTCHQCRQKTLGHRTHCIKCNLVQGQFCGDCLYMRYGENVLEAKQNPEWICPVCRGICNCSLCRQAKGWAPTGIMYRKISSLGYKSVAHYLIQTHRADPNSEKNENPVCAKRSLPFSNEEIKDHKVIEIQSSNESEGKNVKLESDQDSERKNLETEIESGICIATNEVIKDIKPPELESSDEGLNPESECKIPETKVDECEDGNNEASNPGLEYKIPERKVDECEEGNKKPPELQLLDEALNPESEYKIPEMEVDEGEGNKSTANKTEDKKADTEGKSVISPETKPGSRKKRRMVIEHVLENSIAGRLRARRKCT